MARWDSGRLSCGNGKREAKPYWGGGGGREEVIGGAGERLTCSRDDREACVTGAV